VNSVKCVVFSLIFFIAFQGYGLCGMGLFGMGAALYNTGLDQKQSIKERALRLEQRKWSVLALDENAQRKKEEIKVNKQSFVSIKSSAKRNNNNLYFLKKKVNIINNQMGNLLEEYFKRNTKPFDVREERNKSRAWLLLVLDEYAQRDRSSYSY
jgi:hypothetical protein